MKRANKVWTMILLVMAGCGGGKQSTDDFITVDVTKSYPKKELIFQDIMDVEYIVLETGGDFYTQGIVLDVGKNYVLIRNRVSDGNIYVFDRNGKGVRVINRRGQGAEEYQWTSFIMLDEENGEIFVNETAKRCIMVYDLFGNFKRNIRHQEGIWYGDLKSFDKESWIFKNATLEREANTPSFFIKSKHDGSIVKEITIPFNQWKTPTQMRRNEEVSVSFPTAAFSDIIPYLGHWILVELSSDTAYRYLPNHSVLPFWVREPSIQSMNPEKFLFPSIFTDQYIFMRVHTKDYNFETRRYPDEIQLVYDKQAKSIFKYVIYVIYNDDYSDKRQMSIVGRTLNEEIAFWRTIEADELVEDHKKGVLKGKLKEIAANLKEEDNPVIMLVKHKK